MGSTDSGAAEFSVGSIVWVRRRNGSWWPGKIVGPEELSASHLTSPRSGTPVKLLGREDASVDWYNLEKSKRVKAFRCGEFDDCIERAESSQGMPIKKREKYARREDAILHALELEKQQLKKQGKLGMASDCANSKSSGAVKKGLVTPSKSYGNDNLELGNSKSNQFYKKLDPKNEILGSSLSSQKSKEGNQLSGEEDHSEVIPRMRGLQDFGLRIAPSKTKLSPPVSSNGSGKPLVDNSVQALSSGVLKMESTSQVNDKNSLDKRKRLHEGLSGECLVKRRDKRRPLVQVLKSSAKLEVPHSMQPDSATVSTSISGVEPIGVICRAKRSRCVYIPAESSESLDYKAVSQSQSDIEMSDSQIGASRHPNSIEENISGSTEDESDTSETESSESQSDSSETEDMDEDMAGLSDAVLPMEPEVSSLGRYEAQEHGSMGGEPDESMLSGDMSHFYGHYPSSVNEAVSKWQLKGKRNIRNLTKRSVDATDWKGYVYGAYPEEKDFRTEMIGLDNGYSSSRAAFRGRNGVGRSLIDWDDSSWEDQSSSRGYWDIKRERFDPVYDSRYQFGGRSRSMLMDVELKVQASYQKEPVPIVSLMSKLNGKAIIGHPIQIEALEDGSSGHLLPTLDDYGNEAIEFDGSTALPQAWRTARRTANVRVPRPHLSSALDGEEAAYDFPFLDRESKPPSKKSNAGNFGHKPVLVRKNALHNLGPPSDNRKYKKVPKKVSSSSSQKTRTLSSIAIEHNFGNRPTTHDSGDIQMEGLIKPESVPPTTVACIPVKLVFSRLLEKINRPPSKATTSNGALLNSDVERNPS